MFSLVSQFPGLGWGVHSDSMLNLSIKITRLISTDDSRPLRRSFFVSRIGSA